jgi:methanogenic corrinoid protein MtbC1
MQAHLGAGLSAAEAAAAARADAGVEVQVVRSASTGFTPADGANQSELAQAAGRLRSALMNLDREHAERSLDFLLGAFTFETLVRSVILPYLVEVGSRWECGQASVAEEHLATNIFRSRLLALAHNPGGPPRGRVVLACPPDERHDLALVVLAVALSRRGWQITLLGADTPVESVGEAARLLDANLVVVAAMGPERFTAVSGPLRAIATERPVVIAGPGASREVAGDLGAQLLDTDPLDAAATVERLVPHIPAAP